MVDFIGMTEKWDCNHILIAGHKSVDIPDTYEAISVAREHKLAHLVRIEAEAHHLIFILQLLLIGFTIERVLRAEVFELSIGLFEVIEVIFAGLNSHDVIDATTLSLLDDYDDGGRK